jgi:hypothetical protein
MGVPPRDVLAAAARRAVADDHDEWDAPYCFQPLHWDGQALTYRTHVCIMPDVHPAGYPALMAEAAARELTEHPDDPAYAYLLQIEAHGVEAPGLDATEAEREQYRRDRVGRTFHRRPDATEAAVSWVADVHGRVWTAAKPRENPELINERFYPPGRAPSGHLIAGLLAVAYTTGVRAYGLPGPQGPMN